MTVRDDIEHIQRELEDLRDSAGEAAGCAMDARAALNIGDHHGARASLEEITDKLRRPNRPEDLIPMVHQARAEVEDIAESGSRRS